MSVKPGTKLGRYEIRSKLGEGGMGEVYRAVDTQPDRTVAVKILPADIARDKQRLHHVWIIFTSPIQAALARKLASAVLTRTMEQRYAMVSTLMIACFQARKRWLTF